MLGIFDEAVGHQSSIPLLTDAFVSLFRQRLLRPERRDPAFAANSIGRAADGPAFNLLDNSPAARSSMEASCR